MSTEHTPGRLRHKARDLAVHGRPVRGALIINVRRGSTTIVAELTGRSSESNARRLVACWNACEGLSTESLESEGNAFNGWKLASYAMNDAKAQRDELLEALKVAHDHIDMGALEISHCKDAEQIRAAIAKAEGGAA